MYNLFQYSNKLQKDKILQKKKQQQQQFYHKHQQYKKYAYDNMKQRADQFLYNQIIQKKPFVFQDDHKIYRKDRKYQKNKNQKFIGFQTFRPQPTQNIDKFYTSRQRKQQSYVSNKKQNLYQSGFMSNSQISTQPIKNSSISKDQFRITKNDEQYLRTKLSSNVTDRQKISQSAINFNEKANKLYLKFEESRQKLAKARRSSMSRYYDEVSRSMFLTSRLNSKDPSMRKSKHKINNQQQLQQMQLSMIDSTKMSQYFDERNQERRKSKLYFKLTKTMQMLHPNLQKRLQFDSLLKKSHYDRQIDRKNMKSNKNNDQSSIKKSLI